MKIGVVFPQIEMAGDVAGTRKLIAATEALGYDHMLVYDHVIGAEHAGREPPLTGPYDHTMPFHDPFTFSTFAGGLTERLELATAVLILPQRQTVLVAKQAIDVSLFIKGRFRMGVGVGWNPVEYDALGQDFATRGARMDEQIGLLRRLFSEKLVTHEGRWENFERAGMVLAPAEPIPIWMGGFSEPAFRRAGRLGEGFFFMGTPNHADQGSVDAINGQWERVRHHLRESGRDENAFGRELTVITMSSSPRDIADALRYWRDLGHTHGSFVTMRRGFAGADQHIDFIAEVREHFR